VNGPAIFLAALALAGQPQGDPGARIAQSAAAAQALQGPLDGTWILVDGKGRARFIFQIVDPAIPGEPVQAAWREAAGGGPGAATARRRPDGRLVLGFAAEGQRAQVALRHRGGAWRGTLRLAGAVTSVTLRRGPP